MVDFKRINREADAKRTPADRARVAWRELQEDISKDGSCKVSATFELLGRLTPKSDEAPIVEKRAIPVVLRFRDDVVLDEVPTEIPEGRTIEIHRLSECRYYRDMIADGEAEDAEYAVDVTDRNPLVSFRQAVTGYEEFALNADFVRGVIDVAANNDGHFYICAGTRGRYDACKVEAAGVLEWMRGLDVSPEIAALLSPSTAPAM